MQEEFSLLNALSLPTLVLDKKSLQVIYYNERFKDLWDTVKKGDNVEELIGREAKEKIRYLSEKSSPSSERIYINLKQKGRLAVEAGVGSLKDKDFIIVTLRPLSYEQDFDEPINKLYRLLWDIVKLLDISTEEYDFLTRASDLIFDTGLFTYVSLVKKDNNEKIYERGNRFKEGASVCIPISISWGSGEYFFEFVPKDDFNLNVHTLDLISEAVHDIFHGIRHLKISEYLRKISLEDKVVGLPNRQAFMKLLSRSMAEARKLKKALALIVIDIDNFSHINQTFGREAGNKVLKELARRLRSILREDELLARIGADEFGIILRENSVVEGSLKLLERLRESLKNPIVVDTNSIYITVSAGVALFPVDAEEEESLYTCAYTSLQEAKKEGRNTTVFFSKKVKDVSEAYVIVRSEIRRALDKGELTLFYQPKFKLSDGSLAGAEALIRWIKDDKVVPPMKFIPLIEESELIHDVGLFVIEEACKQVKEWKQKGLSVPIAVNVSPSQLTSKDFLRAIPFFEGICQEVKELIEVEITESVIMKNSAEVIEFFDLLSQSGIKTYIDDFGTGYSSLAYLKNLPAYAVKIDREFIKDFPFNQDSLEIVKTIVNLTKKLGFKIVAEGVEKGVQVEVLRDLGCDYAQGFLYSKPIPAEEFEKRFLS